MVEKTSHRAAGARMAMDDVWKKENDMNESCRTWLVLFFFMEKHGFFQMLI